MMVTLVFFFLTLTERWSIFLKHFYGTSQNVATLPHLLTNLFWDIQRETSLFLIIFNY